MTLPAKSRVMKTRKYFVFYFFHGFIINLKCNTFLYWFIIGMEDKVCFMCLVITDSHLTRETTCLILLTVLSNLSKDDS